MVFPWTGLLLSVLTVVIAAVAQFAHEFLKRHNFPITEDPRDLEGWFWKVIKWIFSGVEHAHVTLGAGFRSQLVAASSAGQDVSNTRHRYHQGLESTGVDLWLARVHRNEMAEQLPIPDAIRSRLISNYTEDDVRSALRHVAVEQKSPPALPVVAYMHASNEAEQALVEVTKELGPVNLETAEKRVEEDWDD